MLEKMIESSHGMSQAVSHHPLSTEVWCWYRTSLCEIFAGHNGSGTGFPV